MKSRKPRRFILGIVLFIIVLGILIAFTKYPFAGFFFQPNRYVSFTERSNWEGMTKGVSALDRIEYVNNVKIRNGTHALKMIQAMEPHSEVMFTFKTPDGRKNIRLNLSEFALKDLAVTFLLPSLIGKYHN